MNKKYYIGLQLLGVDNITIIKIMENLDIEDLKSLFKGNLLQIEFKYNIHFDKNKSKFEDLDYLKNILNRSEYILNKNKEFKIRTILYNNKYYPKRLKDIENPPAILYLKGRNITKKDEKSLACIGTRKPTQLAVSTTKSIVKNLSDEKFTIISGLADGIDTISHETSLDNNGRTIAVLAHGLDIIYPNKNHELANRILANGGTLISEYPIGSRIEKYKFVHRNRIVSALSNGILMVEAKIQSGTKHTIDFAIQQNKKIFTPVFNKFSSESELNIELLKSNKAIPIKGDNDYIRIPYTLNYRPVKDKNLFNNLKTYEINKVLSNINLGLNSLCVENLDIKKSFATNKNDYEKLKKILKSKNISVTEFFNSIIQGTIKNN